MAVISLCCRGFTVTANGVGADTLVLQADTLTTALTRTVVLKGVNSAALVNSNFCGLNPSIVPLFAAYAFTLQAGSNVNHHLYVVADGQFYTSARYSTLDADVLPNPAVGFDQVAMTSANFNNHTGGFGVDLNVTATTSINLASVVGTSGNDTFTFATQSFGAANSTVNGGSGGADTIVFSTSAGGTLYGTSHVTGMQIANIDAITLSAGSTGLLLDAAVTTAAVVTNNSNAYSVTDLGSGAAHSFVGNGNGFNAINLGQAQQSVTGGSGIDNVTGYALSLSGVLNGGGGTNCKFLVY